MSQIKCALKSGCLTFDPEYKGYIHSLCTLCIRVSVAIIMCWYTVLFCEHQTNFAMVDQFATIKSAKPKVNTHYPCQNTIVSLQRVNFSADLAHSQWFFTSKIF